MKVVQFESELESDQLGYAAYVRFLPAEDGKNFRGCLFLVNQRGEPVEFTYNQIEASHVFLWGKRLLLSHACRRLLTSLFEACPRSPSVLLCLANEIQPEVFVDAISVAIPVARVARESDVIGVTPSEEYEAIGGDDPIQLFWQTNQPDSDSTAGKLLAVLAERGLLYEPFERATNAFKEIDDEFAPVSTDE